MAIALGAAGVVALRRAPEPPRPRVDAPPPSAPALTPAEVRQALFDELQPVPLANCTLQRFGEKHDGGYLLCANLLGGVRSAYSYGISGYDGWGCQVSRRLKVAVHEYDCFDLTRPACSGGRPVFHPECVGPQATTDKDGRRFDTPESQFARNGDGTNHLVMKIDVEGAEWETFLQMSDAALERIDQLVVEFHGVNRERYLGAVRRLKRVFHVANLHFNNYSCTAGIEPFPSWAYEVLFVSKQLGTLGPGLPQPTLSRSLDARNDPRVADCQTIGR